MHFYQHQKSKRLHQSNGLDRNLSIAIGLNALIVIVELIGGIASGSLALLSDAMHNFSDVAALTIALVARILSRRPASKHHTYGLGRLEVLAALINSGTLLVVATLICREALLRLIHPQEVNGEIMLAVSLVGLIANLLSMLMIKGHSHSDLNMRSAFLHLLQDTLSSVVVVCSALFARFSYGPYLDSGASILVVVLILHSGWGLLKETIRILLEGTPPGLDLGQLQSDIQSNFQIRELHHLHVWELSSGYRLLTAHVLVNEMPFAKVEEVLRQIRSHLASHWSVDHATLEPEVESSRQTFCGHSEIYDSKNETF